MDYALSILRAEFGRLREDNLINSRMINTFLKENVEPSTMLLDKKKETESKLNEVNEALSLLIKTARYDRKKS